MFVANSFCLVNIEGYVFAVDAQTTSIVEVQNINYTFGMTPAVSVIPCM